jgi:hypothetical protein
MHGNSWLSCRAIQTRHQKQAETMHGNSVDYRFGAALT